MDYVKLLNDSKKVISRDDIVRVLNDIPQTYENVKGIKDLVSLSNGVVEQYDSQPLMRLFFVDLYKKIGELDLDNIIDILSGEVTNKQEYEDRIKNDSEFSNFVKMSCADYYGLMDENASSYILNSATLFPNVPEFIMDGRADERLTVNASAANAPQISCDLFDMLVTAKIPFEIRLRNIGKYNLGYTNPIEIYVKEKDLNLAGDLLNTVLGGSTGVLAPNTDLALPSDTKLFGLTQVEFDPETNDYYSNLDYLYGWIQASMDLFFKETIPTYDGTMKARIACLAELKKENKLDLLVDDIMNNLSNSGLDLNSAYSFNNITLSSLLSANNNIDNPILSEVVDNNNVTKEQMSEVVKYIMDKIHEGELETEEAKVLVDEIEASKTIDLSETVKYILYKIHEEENKEEVVVKTPEISDYAKFIMMKAHEESNKVEKLNLSPEAQYIYEMIHIDAQNDVELHKDDEMDDDKNPLAYTTELKDLISQVEAAQAAQVQENPILNEVVDNNDVTPAEMSEVVKYIMTKIHEGELETEEAKVLVDEIEASKTIDLSETVKYILYKIHEDKNEEVSVKAPEISDYAKYIMMQAHKTDEKREISPAAKYIYDKIHEDAQNDIALHESEEVTAAKDPLAYTTELKDLITQVEAAQQAEQIQANPILDEVVDNNDVTPAEMSEVVKYIMTKIHEGELETEEAKVLVDEIEASKTIDLSETVKYILYKIHEDKNEEVVVKAPEISDYAKYIMMQAHKTDEKAEKPAISEVAQFIYDKIHEDAQNDIALHESEEITDDKDPMAYTTELKDLISAIEKEKARLESEVQAEQVEAKNDPFMDMYKKDNEQLDDTIIPVNTNESIEDALKQDTDTKAEMSAVVKYIMDKIHEGEITTTEAKALTEEMDSSKNMELSETVRYIMYKIHEDDKLDIVKADEPKAPEISEFVKYIMMKAHETTTEEKKAISKEAQYIFDMIHSEVESDKEIFATESVDEDVNPLSYTTEIKDLVTSIETAQQKDEEPTKEIPVVVEKTDEKEQSTTPIVPSKYSTKEIKLYDVKAKINKEEANVEPSKEQLTPEERTSIVLGVYKNVINESDAKKKITVNGESMMVIDYLNREDLIHKIDPKKKYTDKDSETPVSGTELLTKYIPLMINHKLSAEDLISQNLIKEVQQVEESSKKFLGLFSFGKKKKNKSA